jgi:hypothetical protein
MRNRLLERRGDQLGRAVGHAGLSFRDARVCRHLAICAVCFVEAM